MELVFAVEVDELDALRVAAGHPDVIDTGAHHLAADGDEHDLVVRFHGQRAADLACLGCGLHSDDALAAARLRAVLVELGSLTDAVLAGYEQCGVPSHNGRSDEAILLAEPNASHAGSSAAHRADVLLVEPNALAVAGDQHDLVVAGGQLDGDEAVALVDADGVDAGAANVGVGAQRGLFHRAALGGEEEEVLLLPREVFLVRPQVGLDTDERSDFLAGLQLKHVGDVSPLGRAAHVWNLVHAPDVHAAGGGEEHQVIMRAGGEEVLDEVLSLALHDGVFAGAHADDAFAAPTLGAVRADIGALDEAVMREGDDDAFVGDEVLNRHVALVGDDVGPARRGVLFFNLYDAFFDDAQHAIFAGDDVHQILDLDEQFVVLALDFVLLKTGQLVQTQIENGVHLHLAEQIKTALNALFIADFDAPFFEHFFRELECQQLDPGFLAVVRLADDTDELVEVG